MRYKLTISIEETGKKLNEYLVCASSNEENEENEGYNLLAVFELYDLAAEIMADMKTAEEVTK